MIHCAIIGVGQLGSRHLQALCHLGSPANIYLVDPSDASRQTARDRYQEAISPDNQHIELFCHTSLDNLPNALDLVIVATNSIVREKAMRDVIAKCSIKSLILEKILFQKKSQYIEVDNLLKESSIPTWVNCWMRTADLFKHIKSNLNFNDSIRMKVEGPQWGLGSNSIHFMDLFTYFADCDDFKFVDIRLENKIFDSKREGFKEFMGYMKGQNSRGDSLDLNCKYEKYGATTIEVQSGSEKYQVLTDFAGFVKFKSSNDLASRTGEISLPYQSELTHIWANDIQTKGSCDLSTYSHAMTLHLELIRVLNDHIQNITGKGIDACPIT
jgi:hypothetical protein